MGAPAGDDHDRRPAGVGVDGGELVALADALEVPDVEAVERHQLTGPGRGVTEPERLRLACYVGDDSCRGRGDHRGPSQAGLAGSQPGGDQVVLGGRRGDRPTLVGQAVREASGPKGRLENGEGQQLLDHMRWGRVRQLRAATGLGHQRVESVAVRSVFPLVVTGARHPERAARLGHVPAARRVVQHGQAPVIDDLCWGHGDGLHGSLVGTTDSITGPHLVGDLQPQPPVSKP